MDSIICLIDALNIVDNLAKNTVTTLEQIEFADFCIITKGEYVGSIILDSIENIIRKVNAQAPIINVKTDQIPINLLLDTCRISDEEIQKRIDEFTKYIIPCTQMFKNDARYSYLHINGEQTIEEVHAEILAKLDSLPSKA